MLLGMSYDEFWECSPERYPVYVRLHDLRRDYENQIRWMDGVYTYKAVQAALEEFGYGLGGAKGQMPQGYIKEPLPVTEKQIKQAEEKRKQDTWNWVMAGQKG